MITETKELFVKHSYSKKQSEDAVLLFEKKISKELADMAETHKRRAHEFAKLVEPYQHHHEIQHEKAASSFAGMKTIVAYNHEQQRLKLANDVSAQEARKKFMLT